MTEREEIDMLRRAVADLTEWVRALETKGTPATHVVTDPCITITPMRGPTYAPPGTPVSAPLRPVTTCVAQAKPGDTALWHGLA